MIAPLLGDAQAKVGAVTTAMRTPNTSARADMGALSLSRRRLLSTSVRDLAKDVFRTAEPLVNSPLGRRAMDITSPRIRPSHKGPSALGRKWTIPAAPLGGIGPPRA